MKKLLATLAVLAVSINANASIKEGTDKARKALKDYQDSYRAVANPAKPFVGVFTTSTGEVLIYTTNVADIAVDTVVGSYEHLRASGKCAKNAYDQQIQPGEYFACAMDLGGGVTATVIQGAGNLGIETINMIGNIATGTLMITGKGLEDAGLWLNKHTGFVGYPVLAVGIVVTATGEVLKQVQVSVVDTAGNVVSGTVNLTLNTASVPADLFRGEFIRAAKGSMGSLAMGACIVAELPIGLANMMARLFNWGASKLGSDHRAQLAEHCSASVKKTVEAYKAGTYVPEVSENDLYHGN